MNKKPISKIFVLPFVLTIFALLGLISTVWVNADTSDTSVTVGNAAPTFTVAVAESPASDTTTPTNAGSNVTFVATAADSNNENYYLAICKTNSVTPVNGSAPTCGGGNWCISTATTSSSQSTCSYTTLDGDSESNVWYAFVCDGNSSAASCSTASQGSGSSGSPFNVNHRPVFNALSNNSPRNPGQDITWSTNSSTLDNDSTGTADTVKLVICKTTGLSAGDCDGGASDRWCDSGFVASNPSCSYSIPIPTVDQSNNAYAYLVDSHNFGATGVNQGGSTSYTVSNVAPVVSSVLLNGGGDITLTEGTTTSVGLTATVTDNNGCTDILQTYASLYRTAINYAGCNIVDNTNANYCYPVVECTQVVAGNTCDGASDSSVGYTCTFTVQYHADPTDATTQYPTDSWTGTIFSTDEILNSNVADSSPVEMLSLIAYDVTSAIGYGSLGAGDSNDPLSITTVYTATGNVGLDAELSGSQMCTNYPTCSGGTPIAVGQQKYAFAALTAYSSGTALTGTPTERELNVLKTTITGSPQTKTAYWGLEVPLGTVSGSYTGLNVLGALRSEPLEW